MSGSAQGISPYFWLVLIAFVVALLARRVRIPYPLALVITGLVIGAPRLLPQAHLDPHLLFAVFLPPLLFESAINLRAQALRRDWKPIAIYTLAGTVLSTFIVGGLSSKALHLPLATALVFGALISTTDPISVIAVFRRLGAGRRLTLIIEAESLFNNDTAVVLFAVMMTAVAGGRLSVWSGLWQFLRLSVGGAAVGAGIGLLASRVHHDLDDHLVEITLTTVVAFGSYICAEALHVSGVMAVVAAGLVIGNVGMSLAMSPGTQLAVTSFWEYAAFVVNSVVFLLIGIEVAYVHWADRVLPALAAVVIVLVARSAIYPLSVVVNWLGGDVPRSWQHILYWGGLRGALSMALALGLGPAFPQRETVVAATFGVVLFSLLAQGLTIGSLLTRLGLSGVPAAETAEHRKLEGDILACEAALAELDRTRSSEAHPGWAVEMLVQDYRIRLSALSAAMESIDPGFRDRERRRTHHSRRLALLAEKSAYREAERRGWLTEEDLKGIAARIDAELVALRREPSEPGTETL